MTLSVVPIYAAALTALFLALSFWVVVRRGKANISLGDGNDSALFARIRAHGNFVEYAPLGLILILIADLQGAGTGWLHLAGAALTLGRISHALALLGVLGMGFRIAGMLATFAALALAAVLAVI